MWFQTESDGVVGQRLKCVVYQWVLGKVMENISKYRDGFLLRIDGEIKWIVPMFCMYCLISLAACICTKIKRLTSCFNCTISAQDAY